MSPVHGPPGFIIPPAATFVYNVYRPATKITHQFRRLGIPLIFPRAVREPAHDNGCGHMAQKFGRPWLKTSLCFVQIRGGKTPFQDYGLLRSESL